MTVPLLRRESKI